MAITNISRWGLLTNFRRHLSTVIMPLLRQNYSQIPQAESGITIGSMQKMRVRILLQVQAFPQRRFRLPVVVLL